LEWKDLCSSDLERAIAHSEKKRHELRDGRIRARYGHSTPHKISMKPADRPLLLYHGTSPEAAGWIRVGGLKPMGRQYVHLAVDRETAERVGGRKAKEPVVLVVEAARAHATGLRF